jgi:hypothetical protein
LWLAADGCLLPKAGELDAGGILAQARERGSPVALPRAGQSDSTAPRASESSTPHPISSSVRSTGDLS